jgi:hypothetical protein
MSHREVCLERREIKQSLLGMEEHSSQVIVYLPEESTDIDLFLVVGAQTKRVREMVGRARG